MQSKQSQGDGLYDKNSLVFAYTSSTWQVALRLSLWPADKKLIPEFGQTPQALPSHSATLFTTATLSSQSFPWYTALFKTTASQYYAVRLLSQWASRYSSLNIHQPVSQKITMFTKFVTFLQESPRPPLKDFLFCCPPPPPLPFSLSLGHSSGRGWGDGSLFVGRFVCSLVSRRSRFYFPILFVCVCGGGGGGCLFLLRCQFCFV